MFSCEKGMKNVRILVQIIFTIFTFYLVYQEMALFISVPIHTTKYKKPFREEQFPDIYVCHIPGFNLAMLTKHGFRGSFHYLQGIIENERKSRGWNGNGTNTSLEDVIRDISSISSVQMCPPVYLGSSGIHYVNV